MNKHTGSLIDAVAQAGKYLADNFSGAKDQTLKEDTHYTIKDDRVVDLIYSKVLSATNIPVCSEESMLKTLPETYWLVDPIEGTTNYAHGTPFYASQACLIDKNEVIIAAVYAPTLNQFFFAEKGKGATLNNLPIKIGKTDSLSRAIISPNKGTGIENLQKWGLLVTTFSTKVRTVRLFGAVGLELAYVAAGYLDLHLNSGCHAYDDAPGSLLVKEAGGVVQNFSAKNWQIEDQTIIAGNPKLVGKAIALIR
jgi:myo-inositol-1(or 4)-monophosphatase